jgi:hypothetical protein
MDRACLKLTGKSSAHGLKQAQEIEQRTAAPEIEPTLAK